MKRKIEILRTVPAHPGPVATKSVPGTPQYSSQDYVQRKLQLLASSQDALRAKVLWMQKSDESAPSFSKLLVRLPLRTGEEYLSGPELSDQERQGLQRRLALLERARRARSDLANERDDREAIDFAAILFASLLPQSTDVRTTDAAALLVENVAELMAVNEYRVAERGRRESTDLVDAASLIRLSRAARAEADIAGFGSREAGMPSLAEAEVAAGGRGAAASATVEKALASTRAALELSQALGL